MKNKSKTPVAPPHEKGKKSKHKTNTAALTRSGSQLKQPALPTQHTDSANAHSPLLKLPPELRNEILKIVLQRRRDRWDRLMITKCKGRYGSGTFKEPAILATCKQLRQEGLPVYYGANIFETCCKASLIKALKDLGVERRKMLHQLRHHSHLFFQRSRMNERETKHIELLCKGISRIGGPRLLGVLQVRIFDDLATDDLQWISLNQARQLADEHSQS